MIYAYKERNKLGNYQTYAGTRYVVHTACRLMGVVKDCWKEYESLEVALCTMKLTPVSEPENSDR